MSAAAFGTRIAIVHDDGYPTESLLANLSRGERERADAFPSERRRRHFALGRLAARRALCDLRPRGRLSEILTGTNGEPVVASSGAPAAGVSIAHDDRLAVACAWLGRGRGRGVGVDVERCRPCGLADSEYAFSPREQALLRAVGGGSLVALSAWAAKEAAWKALVLPPAIGPEALELTLLALDRGRALLRERTHLSTRDDGQTLTARLRLVAGRDGPYLLAVASTRSDRHA